MEAVEVMVMRGEYGRALEMLEAGDGMVADENGFLLYIQLLYLTGRRTEGEECMKQRYGSFQAYPIVLFELYVKNHLEEFENGEKKEMAAGVAGWLDCEGIIARVHEVCGEMLGDEGRALIYERYPQLVPEEREEEEVQPAPAETAVQVERVDWKRLLRYVVYVLGLEWVLRKVMTIKRS